MNLSGETLSSALFGHEPHDLLSGNRKEDKIKDAIDLDGFPVCKQSSSIHYSHSQP